MILSQTNEVTFKGCEHRDGYIWIYFDSPAFKNSFLCLTRDEAYKLDMDLGLTLFDMGLEAKKHEM